MDRLFIGIGAISGFLSVAAGAFGAHALKKRLAPELLAVFQTGAQYQMYHALALVLVGLLIARSPQPALTLSGWAFALGTALFSGSLYALALTDIKVLGAITPLGGLGFLLGWAALAFATFRG